MLQELNQLGTHLDLPPLGYNYVIAHWLIDASTGSITLLEEEPEKPGSKPRIGKRQLLPDLRRNGDEPLLIDDGGEYVFGAGERGSKRQALYLELLERCIAETNDEAAKHVKAYLLSCDLPQLDQHLSERVPPKTKRDGTLEERSPFWWARDRFIFSLDGELITQRAAIQDWWIAYYTSKQDVQTGRCLLTGEETLTVAHKMPLMVKGVPGTVSSGAALSSFDKAAYQGFGWEGNTNALIGFEAAIRSHTTLNQLLQNPQHHWRFGEQVFVFWGDQAGEGLNFEAWNDPSAETLKRLFLSPNRPQDRPGDRALSRHFYLAALKGNRGRIALSSWDQQTPAKLKASIQQFIHCQQLRPDLKPKPLWVLRNAAFFDPNKEHTAKIDSALMRSVLLGVPLPQEYAIRLMNRICVEQDTFRSLDRAQALAFYLTTTMQTLPTEPDGEERPTPEQIAFILGRIAFLMHWAQYVAQKLSREETNVSRSLRTLATTPAQMFPRLYYGCIANHLEDRDGGKQLGYLKHCLNEEFAKFGPNFNPAIDLPNTFSVKAQTCFFLGWGMRRAEFFQPKDKENQDND